MKFIGLTGGISSGKSTVAGMFKELDIPIIDADQISRQLTKPGTILTQKIIDHFGAEYCESAKSIHRKKIRARIFSHPEDKVWLETLLHPEIYKSIQKKVAYYQSPTLKKKPPYVIIIIPLLFEIGRPEFIDEVWSMDLPDSLQLSWLRARDKITEKQAKKIISQQYPRADRLCQADKIISNLRDIPWLKSQVIKLHQSLCKPS